MITADSFYLDPTATGTLQEQIRQMVVGAILSGRAASGARMPSSRALAKHLGVSRITVTLAYTDLVASDYLTSRGRSGYFVSDSAPRPPQPPGPAPQTDRVDWSRVLPHHRAEMPGPIRPADWHRYRFPFIYGQADAQLFDHQNWRQCALKALGTRDFQALAVDHYESDDPLLIEFIIRHILPRRGITATPDQILLTMGAQNALWLSAQLLLGPGRTAVLENPGYPWLRQVLAQTGCQCRALNVDEGGLPVDQLGPDMDVVYTTPSHQSPTNATMPADRRKALLDAAATHEFLIVEDDYEFELAHARAPQPALKAHDRDGRVIHIGSFSKSLFPGLRLGYLVGAAPFIRQARALRAAVLRHPPGHIQRTVAYFLSLGHYDAQLARMARVYGDRRRVMIEALASHGLTPVGGRDGGSSFWMRAPAGIDTDELATWLRDRDVLIEPGHDFFAPEQDDHSHYRLAYSSIPAVRIPEGIARLADALRT